MFVKPIHIVFNSRERARITQPIIENPPNKLYYFTAIIRETGQNDVNLSYFKQNLALLEKQLPQMEIINKEVDYTQYIEIIQEISMIIKYERDLNPNSKIYINVGSGSKITAIASIEAAKLWDCDVYYVYSTDYDPSGTGPDHKGDMIIKIPMTFPIQKPDRKVIEILRFIQEMIEERYQNKTHENTQPKFIYKKDLIEQLFEDKLITLISENPEERKLQASKYMKSRKYLKPMNEKLNFINISDDKRNKKIYITELGKEVIEIFKYQI